ncbi:hypothetical protein EC973_005955 [Apophysomyces ossiformis]|uniref:CNH domain-containing protein n=1 Tax=Apophysomyces ossiformis TaxID=679940 RepID=A0A8H7BTX0_9FUNG|nr:hypothetical protein EC973_005955 [Apophysomyces ossiformis]
MTLSEQNVPLPSAPPPPYTPHSQHHDSVERNDVPEARETEQADLSRLELKLLATERSVGSYECGCVLEDRFLLLGHSVLGIQVLDMERPTKTQTIIWARARKMIVIESSRIVLMLAGRSKQIRCYSLDALLRLIYAVLGLDWRKRLVPEYDLPSLDAWRHVASQAGKAPDVEPTAQAPGNENLQGKVVMVAGIAKNHYAFGNTVLQNYCYKFPESKDALDLRIYHTTAYIFAAVLHRDKIVLWQRKRDADNLHAFFRLKVFWIPTEPRSIAFADDRVTLRHILAVFSTEATAINLRDSKVQTIPIHAKVEELYQSTWMREQYEHRLSNPRPPASPVPTMFPRPSLPSTLSLPIHWTSLIQLPFYPECLPATSLTTQYSIPPSYNTVVATTPFEAPDPVALPSTAAPQLFFATLGRQSFIIDLNGALFTTQVYHWSDEPDHIEFVKIRNDWCAVGFGRDTVDLVHITTAKKQRLMNGVPVRFLSHWRTALLWSCTANDKSHVYMLQTDV